MSHASVCTVKDGKASGPTKAVREPVRRGDDAVAMPLAVMPKGDAPQLVEGFREAIATERGFKLAEEGSSGALSLQLTLVGAVVGARKLELKLVDSKSREVLAHTLDANL